MPSFITRDYQCADPNCGHRWPELLDRTESEPEQLFCPDCMGPADRCISATIMQAAYPDGSKRFQVHREQRALQREERKAARKGNKPELKRLAAEKAKL